MNSSSNAAHNGARRHSAAAPSRVCGEVSNPQVRGASSAKALLPAARRLLYPQGRAASSGKRGDPSSQGSLRKPSQPLRKQRRLGVIGTVSVSAVNVAHHALWLALDLVREVVESRRSVDAQSRQGRGVELPMTDQKFWDGLR